MDSSLDTYTPSTANCDLYIYCSAGIRERNNVADDVEVWHYLLVTIQTH